MGQIPPFVYALLGWVGGAATTVAGSWVASKIHVFHENRNSHRDELREKVLVPVLSTLESAYGPLLRFERPLLSSQWKGQTFKEGARSTEDQIQYGEGFELANPWPKFEDTVDAALYQDAKIKHFVQLIRELESFAAAWKGFAENLEEWIQDMAQQLRLATGLPPPNHGAMQEPHARHEHLAIFIYKRICRLPAGTLSKSSTGSPLWSLSTGAITVAMASPQQLDTVIQAVDEMITGQRQKGEFFMDRAKQLASQLDALSGEIRLAIASKRLPNGCDLVRFF